ncbi:MAG: hydroxyacid dehydrogenase [Candidatus Paceibacterota bacterium]|jgi:D-lactate dehydrogenase
MKTLFFELENWEREFIEASSKSDLVTQSTTSNLPTEPEVVSRVARSDFEFVEGVLAEETIAKLTDEQKEAEIISIFVDSVINAKVLESFPNLKMIATRSTGYDHIELEACRAKGIMVANVPSYGEETVAEYAFALMLTLSRKIFESYDRIKETGSFDLTGMRGFDLNGKTLGVIGTGKIGKNVIEIANGFNMKVIAYDKFPDEAYRQKMGYEYLSFDEVLAQSDILTLHVPFLPENEHLINAETIAKMKKGVYLINTARGALVDTDALLKALQSGQIAGAGLDVLEEEGVIKDELNFLTRLSSGQASAHQNGHNFKTILENHVLVDLPNVVITPHNAFNTWEALKRILNTTLENIKSFSAGIPQNLVK